VKVERKRTEGEERRDKEGIKEWGQRAK